MYSNDVVNMNLTAYTACGIAHKLGSVRVVVVHVVDCCRCYTRNTFVDDTHDSRLVVFVRSGSPCVPHVQCTWTVLAGWNVCMTLSLLQVPHMGVVVTYVVLQPRIYVYASQVTIVRYAGFYQGVRRQRFQPHHYIIRFPGSRTMGYRFTIQVYRPEI